jgi:hypothetical protein
VKVFSVVSKMDNCHPESLRAEIESLKLDREQLWREVRELQKENDTFVKTPLWKKCLFWLDGWPLIRIVARRQWRPWHLDRWPLSYFSGR